MNIKYALIMIIYIKCDNIYILRIHVYMIYGLAMQIQNIPRLPLVCLVVFYEYNEKVWRIGNIERTAHLNLTQI